MAKWFSYGIQVAKLAGLPAPAVARAKELLAEFEAAERLSNADRQAEDLPLFTAASPPPAQDRDVLGSALDAIDPDELSPRAAMEALYQLKKLRAKER